MNVHKAAELLGVKRHAVYQYHRMGILRTTRTDRGLLDFDEDDVKALVKARSLPGETIAYRIVEALGYDLDVLRGSCRSACCGNQRKAVSVLMYEEGFPIAAIGRFVNRDSSTVFTWVNSVSRNSGFIKEAMRIWEEKKKE